MTTTANFHPSRHIDAELGHFKTIAENKAVEISTRIRSETKKKRKGEMKWRASYVTAMSLTAFNTTKL